MNHVKTLQIAVLLTSMLIVVGLVPAQAQEWRKVRVKKGLVLMSRSIDGERFPEFRIHTVTRLSTTKLVSYLMGRSIEEADPGMERKIIERSADFAEWTDLIKTPILNDRCATSRVWLKKTGKSGEIDIMFVSSDDWPRGKPTAACVPLRAHGAWSLQPTAEGTELTYTIFADPGGNVPAFLARGMIEDDTINRVIQTIDEAAK